jgi:sugar phosphate isomerase/epimerase
MIYLGGWFDCAESEWPNVRSTCLHRLEQAAQIGASFVIAGPPAGRADPRLGARRYRELLDAGQRIGARPAMEFLGFVEQYCTIESAQEVLALAQHPAGTLVLDPFHIFRGGGDMETIAQLPASQIAISHFNDTPASPPRSQQQDSDRVWPGAGHLNLTRYLQLLHGTGYDRWLSLELFREDLWQRDPTEVAREGLIRMRAVVSDAHLS